jgi:DNA-directed RNA polymerase subunit RPC12/RpoP
MMYCRRCNNTHWEKSEPQGLLEWLAFLRLQQPYRCTKCGRIKFGSIFLNFKRSNAAMRNSKEQHRKSRVMKCPRCGGHVRRSHRKGIEKLLFFTKTYRCSECETRFRKLKLG